MKHLVILLAVAIASCTNQQSSEQPENKMENEKAVATVPLNNGVKWKADEVTIKNVAALVQVANDSMLADVAKREQLVKSIQVQLDTLIRQCSMKGAEHDALHVWLEKVLKDVKELKEDDHEFNNARAALKTDVQSFYLYFE